MQHIVAVFTSIGNSCYIIYYVNKFVRARYFLLTTRPQSGLYHSVCIEVYNISGPFQYLETNLQLKHGLTTEVQESMDQGQRLDMAVCLPSYNLSWAGLVGALRKSECVIVQFECLFNMYVQLLVKCFRSWTGTHTKEVNVQLAREMTCLSSNHTPLMA